MRCLVVGGNGFMGAHLVDRLLKEGHRVRVYDRSPNRFRSLPGGAEYVEGDLGNHGLVREALEDVEVVYHLVSTTLPKTSNDDPIYDVRSNLVDTLQLLDLCVERGVRKVVFASSGGTVYGPPETTPITEAHPTEPISSYGIVKLAVEKYLGLYRHLHGLEYSALRISNPYGPLQDPLGQQGAAIVFLYRLYTGQPISVWGDGGVVRDYVYVSDVAEALEAAAFHDGGAGVLNLGSGSGTSVNELLLTIAEVTGEQPRVEYLPSRTMDVPASVLDVNRARENLGWEPRVELSEGIATTWDWVRSLSSSRVEES